MSESESREQSSEQSGEQEERAPRRGRRAEPEQHQQETPVPDIPVSQLVAESGVFTGHPSWAAAGALHDHDPEEMMSIEAAKSEIEAWLQKPVEVAGEEE